MQVADSNKRRRDSLRLALACFVLQLAVAPNIGIGNGHINFALVFCAIVSLTTGGRWGVLCGFFSGLVFDLCSTGPIGLMALLLTIGSFVMGMECRNRLVEDHSAAIVLFFVVCAFVVIAYQLTMLLVGDAHSFADVLFLRALPTAALTSVVFLLVAHLMGGGNRSKRGVGKHGGKYDLGRM